MDVNLVSDVSWSQKLVLSSNLETHLVLIIIGLVALVLFTLGGVGVLLGPLFLSPTAGLGLVIIGLVLLASLCNFWRSILVCTSVQVQGLDAPLSE